MYFLIKIFDNLFIFFNFKFIDSFMYIKKIQLTYNIKLKLTLIYCIYHGFKTQVKVLFKILKKKIVECEKRISIYT